MASIRRWMDNIWTWREQSKTQISGWMIETRWKDKEECQTQTTSRWLTTYWTNSRRWARVASTLTYLGMLIHLTQLPRTCRPRMTQRVSGLLPTTCRLKTIITFSDRLRNILVMARDNSPRPEFKITDDENDLLRCI